MSEKYNEWFKKADNDLKTAEILLNDNDPPTDTLCYHCQQAVEKYLKGFLTKNGIDFIKSHDLDYLTKLCSKLDPSFANESDTIISLTKYAIETRYPADLPIYYPIEEAKMAFETAQEIVRFIKIKI